MARPVGQRPARRKPGPSGPRGSGKEASGGVPHVKGFASPVRASTMQEA